MNEPRPPFCPHTIVHDAGVYSAGLYALVATPGERHRERDLKAVCQHRHRDFAAAALCAKGAASREIGPEFRRVRLGDLIDPDAYVTEARTHA